MSLRRADRAVAGLAAEQWGVVSHGEMLRLGMTPAGIEARVRRGSIHRLHHGVYGVGHGSVRFEGRQLAAVKACEPDSHLSHVAAAAIMKMVDRDDSRRPQVTVPWGHTRRHPDIRVHRTRRLDRPDRRRDKDIPITSPERTLLDLAATEHPKLLRRAVRRAFGHRLVSVVSIAAVLRRYPGRQGSRQLAETISSGPQATVSELEDLVLDLVLSTGFEQPEVNRPMRLDGIRVVPDLRWPDQKLVVEADGGAWHDNPLARREDAERQALLEAHGERVLRVTWQQATSGWRRTIDRLRKAGAPPSTEGPHRGAALSG